MGRGQFSHKSTTDLDGQLIWALCPRPPRTPSSDRPAGSRGPPAAAAQRSAALSRRATAAASVERRAQASQDRMTRRTDRGSPATTLRRRPPGLIGQARRPTPDRGPASAAEQPGGCGTPWLAGPGPRRGMQAADVRTPPGGAAGFSRVQGPAGPVGAGFLAACRHRKNTRATNTNDVAASRHRTAARCWARIPPCHWPLAALTAPGVAAGGSTRRKPGGGLPCPSRGDGPATEAAAAPARMHVGEPMLGVADEDPDRKLVVRSSTWSGCARDLHSDRGELGSDSPASCAGAHQ